MKANVFSGSSVLDAGSPTGESVEVERVLSPVTQRECGTIRCIGLNVRFTCLILVISRVEDLEDFLLLKKSA